MFVGGTVRLTAQPVSVGTSRGYLRIASVWCLSNDIQVSILVYGIFLLACAAKIVLKLQPCSEIT